MASTIYTYSLTGGRVFPVAFEYLARRFVRITLVGATRLELQLNVDYRFISKTEIETTIAWSQGEYQTIEVRRVTSATDRLVNFTDGSILRSQDLNIAQIQAIHIAEEGRDVAENSLLTDGFSWNALGRPIQNLGYPTRPADATNVSYVRDQIGCTLRGVQGETINEIPVDRSNKILGFDANRQPIVLIPATGSSMDLELALADGLDVSRGASKLMSNLDVPGSIPFSVRVGLKQQVHAGAHFGLMDTLSAAEQTTRAKAFYTHCILTGTSGHIHRGNYTFLEGELVFDCNWTDKPFPIITTDGHSYVTFNAAGVADKPILTFTNGVATTENGKYWMGGYHGGVTFKDSTGDVVKNRHGLSLTGVWAMRFGWMRGVNLKGSVLSIPQKLFNTNNPDPYAVGFCTFDGVEANYCEYAINNQNFLGFNASEVKYLRVVGSRSGGWYGTGTGNTVDFISAGACAGWVVDDGTQLNAAGGAPLRLTIWGAEIDDCQYGISLNRQRQAGLHNIRIVYRCNSNGLNNNEGYWPRIGIRLGGGVLASVSEIDINVTHRIQAGGIKAQFGTFVDLTSDQQLSNVSIVQRFNDNSGMGFVNNEFAKNINSNAMVYSTINGAPCVDLRVRGEATVRGDVSVQIPTGGYPAETALVKFTASPSNKGQFYNITTGFFTAPVTGLYNASWRLRLAIPVGKRLRAGFSRLPKTGGPSNPVLLYETRSHDALASTYRDAGVISLQEGDRLYFMADQDTGAPLNLQVAFSNDAENLWAVTKT